MRAITDAATATLGTDHTWFRSLPGRLAALGLTGIGIRADTPPVAGGGDLARTFQLTLDAVSQTALRQGLLDEDTIRQATARLADPGYLDLILTLIHTWGHRPR